jgi:hypothetical protein
MPKLCLSESTPPACGFVATTSLFTQWGPTRIHDLARLSTRRDQLQRDYASGLAARGAEHAQRLAAIHAASAETIAHLKGVDTTELQAHFAGACTALVNKFETETEEIEAAVALELSGVLPRCRVDVSEERAIECVYLLDEPVIDFVDVTIGIMQIDNGDKPMTEHAVKLRCTPDTLFVTANGDVRADALLDVEIQRQLPDGSFDTYVVPEVTAYVAPSPVSLYAVRVQDGTCVCVGVDGTLAAVVRCVAV